MAYGQFAERRLRPGESVDVYLAELRKLSVLFGGMSDHGLSCGFVRWLPKRVKQLLHASTRIYELSIGQFLVRARAIMKDEVLEKGLAVVTVRTTRDEARKLSTEDPPGYITSYHCNGPNHFEQDCKEPHTERRTLRMRCYKCYAVGHVVRSCPGKDPG